MADQKMGNNKGEKSNFSLTCSLLSQYLKEKNGFGGLGLEMAAAKPLDQQAKGEIFPFSLQFISSSFSLAPNRIFLMSDLQLFFCSFMRFRFG